MSIYKWKSNHLQSNWVFRNHHGCFKWEPYFPSMVGSSPWALPWAVAQCRPANSSQKVCLILPLPPTKPPHTIAHAHACNKFSKSLDHGGVGFPVLIESHPLTFSIRSTAVSSVSPLQCRLVLKLSLCRPATSTTLPRITNLEHPKGANLD
jgi:hypothetical protein